MDHPPVVDQLYVDGPVTYMGDHVHFPKRNPQGIRHKPVLSKRHIFPTCHHLRAVWREQPVSCDIIFIYFISSSHVFQYLPILFQQSEKRSRKLAKNRSSRTDHDVGCPLPSPCGCTAIYTGNHNYTAFHHRGHGIALGNDYIGR